MYLASDLRKGLKFEIDGEPYIIVDFEFKKPGKGQSLYKCKLKNMITGSQFERTYRSGDKFEKADLEEQEMEYLYADKDTYCFMNTSNYEQIFLTRNQLDDVIDLLKENTVCTVLLHNQKPIGVTLPNFINLMITKTEPGMRKDRSPLSKNRWMIPRSRTAPNAENPWFRRTAGSGCFWPVPDIRNARTRNR